MSDAIAELKSMLANYKAAGKLREAKAIGSAINRLRTAEAGKASRGAEHTAKSRAPSSSFAPLIAGAPGSTPGAVHPHG